jgi:hypothetical protein
MASPCTRFACALQAADRKGVVFKWTKYRTILQPNTELILNLDTATTAHRRLWWALHNKVAFKGEYKHILQASRLGDVFITAVATYRPAPSVCIHVVQSASDVCIYYQWQAGGNLICIPSEQVSTGSLCSQWRPRHLPTRFGYTSECVAQFRGRKTRLVFGRSRVSKGVSYRAYLDVHRRMPRDIPRSTPSSSLLICNSCTVT